MLRTVLRYELSRTFSSFGWLLVLPLIPGAIMVAMAFFLRENLYVTMPVLLPGFGIVGGFHGWTVVQQPNAIGESAGGFWMSKPISRRNAFCARSMSLAANGSVVLVILLLFFIFLSEKPLSPAKVSLHTYAEMQVVEKAGHTLVHANQNRKDCFEQWKSHGNVKSRACMQRSHTAFFFALNPLVVYVLVYWCWFLIDGLLVLAKEVYDPKPKGRSQLPWYAKFGPWVVAAAAIGVIFVPVLGWFCSREGMFSSLTIALYPWAIPVAGLILVLAMFFVVLKRFEKGDVV